MNSVCNVSVAALPLSLRKASGFPTRFLVVEASPRRHSRQKFLWVAGKAEPFRKECG
jgi:hypothetical protein